jgi:hypothetical protein
MTQEQQAELIAALEAIAEIASIRYQDEVRFEGKVIDAYTAIRIVKEHFAKQVEPIDELCPFCGEDMAIRNGRLRCRANWDGGKCEMNVPYYSPAMAQEGLLNPDMPAQELRLHGGEMTGREEGMARMFIRLANSRRVDEKTMDEIFNIAFKAYNEKADETEGRYCDAGLLEVALYAISPYLRRPVDIEAGAKAMQNLFPVVKHGTDQSGNWSVKSLEIEVFERAAKQCAVAWNLQIDEKG